MKTQNPNTEKTGLLGRVSIKKLLMLVVVFVGLKGLAFVSPLLVSQISSSPSDYGAFEYAFNLGTTLMGVFAMGLSASYAYFILKHDNKELTPVFHVHFVVLTGLLLLSYIIMPSLAENIYFLAIVTGVIMANQIMVSSILKVNGKNNLSILADTGIYIVLTVLVVVLYVFEQSFSKVVWSVTLLMTLLVFTLLYHLKRCAGFRQVSWLSASELYKFGLLVVIASPLVFLITNNTRIYVSHFMGMETVGFYSFFFRLASVLLLVSRLIHILLFRRFFVSEHDKLDRYLALSSVGLGGIVFFALLLFQSPLGDWFLSYFPEYADHAYLLPFCFFQVIFWIGTSFFEAILVREKLMKPFIVLLVITVLFLLATLQLFAIYSVLNLTTLIAINTGYILLLFAGQQWILAKQKIFYRKTWAVQGIMGTLFLLFLWMYL